MFKKSANLYGSEYLTIFLQKGLSSLRHLAEQKSVTDGRTDELTNKYIFVLVYENKATLGQAKISTDITPNPLQLLIVSDQSLIWLIRFQFYGNDALNVESVCKLRRKYISEPWNKI